MAKKKQRKELNTDYQIKIRFCERCNNPVFHGLFELGLYDMVICKECKEETTQ